MVEAGWIVQQARESFGVVLPLAKIGRRNAKREVTCSSLQFPYLPYLMFPSTFLDIGHDL